MLHAHVSSESADCDGRYSRTYIALMTDEEIADQWGESDFKGRMVDTTVNPNGHGALTVTPDLIIWSEATEEGFRHVEVEWCTDDDTDCDPTYRDHSAEAMNY